MDSMKNTVFSVFVSLVMTLGAMISLGACDRSPTDDQGLSATDRQKMQQRTQRVLTRTTLENLPERYRHREKPDREKGELFELYIDGEFARTVMAGEFACADSELRYFSKGPKLFENCPILPFLRRISQTDPALVELVGDGRDYRRAWFIPNRLAAEDVELVGFINPAGQLRVEARPSGALMTKRQVEEHRAAIEAGEKPKRIKKKDGGKGRKGGGMKNQYKTRALFWVDLYTKIPEFAKVSAEEADAPARHQALPSVAGKLVILSEAGDVVWVTQKEAEACGEEGCALGEWLPSDSAGLWCVAYAGGVNAVSAEDLAAYRLRSRRQTEGMTLKHPTTAGRAIREPRTIAPCDLKSLPEWADKMRESEGQSTGDAAAASQPALTLEMPGGERKVLSEAEAEQTCGERGCPMGTLLPEAFGGEWCVTTPAGMVRLAHGELLSRVLRVRKRGGFAIGEPNGGDDHGGAIRDPSLVAPCR